MSRPPDYGATIHSLPCPRCGERRCAVFNSRPHTDHVWRRRRCLNCGHKFTTHEVETDVLKPKPTTQ